MNDYERLRDELIQMSKAFANFALHARSAEYLAPEVADAEARAFEFVVDEIVALLGIDPPATTQE